jgi:hypothetical protein
MNLPVSGSSVVTRARLAGLFYVVTIIAGLFAEAFVRGQIIVARDPAATAANLLSAVQLYRLGISADLIMLLAYVAVTSLFYEIFAVVSPSLSRFAALLSVTGIAVLGASVVNLLGSLVFLQDPSLGLSPAETAALAYSHVRLHAQGYDVSGVFFGAYCVVIGLLILRSTFLPGVLGLLMILGGVCYLGDSYRVILAIPLPGTLAEVVLLPGVVAEGALALWLLSRGLDRQKWASAGAAALGAWSR